ncbi:MAG: hypothetical protein S4CHLAM102_11700 [Chlamydiia bacterium]|nr:hypothetical protein [Chlamydiia bacterium]
MGVGHGGRIIDSIAYHGDWLFAGDFFDEGELVFGLEVGVVGVDGELVGDKLSVVGVVTGEHDELVARLGVEGLHEGFDIVSYVVEEVEEVEGGFYFEEGDDMPLFEELIFDRLN